MKIILEIQYSSTQEIIWIKFDSNQQTIVYNWNNIKFQLKNLIQITEKDHTFQKHYD